jgi:hypothetical protein
MHTLKHTGQIISVALLLKANCIIADLQIVCEMAAITREDHQEGLKTEAMI